MVNAVFTQGFLLNEKALELPHLLLQLGVGFFRNLVYYNRRQTFRVTTGFIQVVNQPFFTHASKITKSHSVERRDVFGYNHHVISRLIGDEQFSISIIDKSSFGVFSNFEYGVVFG